MNVQAVCFILLGNMTENQCQDQLNMLPQLSAYFSFVLFVALMDH